MKIEVFIEEVIKDEEVPGDGLETKVIDRFGVEDPGPGFQAWDRVNSLILRRVEGMGYKLTGWKHVTAAGFGTAVLEDGCKVHTYVVPEA